MSDITAQSVHKQQRKLASLKASYEDLLADLYREYDAAARQGHVGFNQPFEYPQAVKLRGQVEEQADIVQVLHEEIGGIVYRVPVVNVGVLESKVAKVARRAAKLDAAPVTLTDSGERDFVEHKDERGLKQIREYHFLVLAGQTPQVPGFNFLATIEHTEAGNLVKRIPQIAADWKGLKDVESIDLTAYRTGEPICQHCNLTRNRKDTYVVFNQAEGTLVQVGRNCLGDYTGTHNPERIAAMAEWLRDFDLGAEGEDDDDWYGGSYEKRWMTSEYLAHVATCIRHYGWTPRSYGDGATADAALSNVMDYGKYDRKTGNPLFVRVEEQDVARADEALAFARSIEDTTNDYMHNLKVACTLEVITRKQAGIVASAISAHDRAMERETKRRLEQERKSNSANEFIGAEKERLRGLDLTVTGIREIERQGYGGYGSFDVTVLYSFEDAKGNVVKWFASSSQGIEIGDQVRLDGTVKKHEVWQGTNQTVMTRCKLVITKEVTAA